jgi:hypothetical protein
MDNTETKVCNTCAEEKDISQYATFFVKARNKYYTENRCRNCKNKRAKELMRTKNKEPEYKEKRKAYEKDYNERKKRGEDTSATRNRIPLTGEDLVRQKERAAEYSKQYNQINKEHKNNLKKEWCRKKRQDPLYRLKSNMKSLLSMKVQKQERSGTYFGTSMELICQWFEFNFTDDMSWGNYGKYWQIDHTIAINNWDLEEHEEALLCFNWKNLMPLQRIHNIKKATKLEPFRVFYQETKLRAFFAQYEVEEDLETYLTEYNDKFVSLLPEFYARHT